MKKNMTQAEKSEKVVVSNGRVEEAEEEADFDLDDNLVHLGVKGFFPSGLYLILSFFVFLTPMQYMSSHVSAFTPDHRCKLPPHPSESTNASSSSSNLYSVDDVIPRRNVDGVEVYVSCERFENSYETPRGSVEANASRKRIPCDHGWDYNASSSDSIVAEFDLVCSKAWLAGFTTSIFNVGQGFAGLIVQPLADRFGRKWMLIGTFLGIALTGTITATLINGAISFVISKFFLGLFFGGGLLVCFVMQIELYPSKHRMWAGMVVEPIWGLGAATVALAAWLFPQWRHYHLATSLPIFAVICIAFIFPPDSLPWLMMNGKHKQARRYLEAKLSMKGKQLVLLSESEKELNSLIDGPKANSGELKPAAPASEDGSSMKMLLNGRIIKQVLIFAFVTTVNSLVYYALSLMSTDLSGDRNISLFLSGIVEVPGYILAGICLHFMGRRGPTLFFHLLVGIFMIIVAAIQIGVPTPLSQGLNIFSQICYFGAKLSISASYAIIFLYCPETFPTNVRNTCFGIVDMVARIGGIAAPYSSYLASISHASVPVFFFATLAFVSGVLALLLPEVHGEALPDTLEDLERLVDGTRMWSMTGKRKETKRRRKSTIASRGGGGTYEA